MTSDKQERKEHPIASGVLDYFPDAIAAVANVSFVGNQQHNPGQPMHWDRSKSKDQADCIARHLLERGTLDTDGLRHSAKVAWRALALLQEEIEKDRESACPEWRKFLEFMRGCTVYISGPMRGYPNLNFPAFDEAAALGRHWGFKVISPAEEDRKRGVDPATFKDSPQSSREFARRDIDLLFDCQAIAVLPGWDKSRGAHAEVALARWLELPILDALTFKKLEDKTITFPEGA